MLRRLIWPYFLVAITMIATSFYTGRRATTISGRPHYMFTTTRVLVDEDVPPENAGDAAFDAALREEGESTKIPVERPIFVLGFIDATGPFVLGGGAILLTLWAWRALRRRRPTIGPKPGPDV
ncbi:MAG: hypothetical protein AABZ08_02290 [Planctomycetota bacterium]